MAEKKIGGRTLRVEPMLATRAMVMQARLFRILGPAIGRLGEIMQGFGPDKSEAEKAASNMAAISAFADIFGGTDPEELAGMIRELIETAQIKRESGSYDPVDFDGDFTTHQGDIIPVVVWVLREQFGDFFSGLLGLGSQSSPALR